MANQSERQTFLDLLESQDNDTLLHNITSLEDIEASHAKLQSLMDVLEMRKMTHQSLSMAQRLQRSVKLIDSNYNFKANHSENMCGADFDAKFRVGRNQCSIELSGDIEDYEGDLRGSFGLGQLFCIEALESSDDSAYFDCAQVANFFNRCGFTETINNNNQLVRVQVHEVARLKQFVKDLITLCFNKARATDKFTDGLFVDLNQILTVIDNCVAQ